MKEIDRPLWERLRSIAKSEDDPNSLGCRYRNLIAGGTYTPEQREEAVQYAQGNG